MCPVPFFTLLYVPSSILQSLLCAQFHFTLLYCICLAPCLLSYVCLAPCLLFFMCSVPFITLLYVPSSRFYYSPSCVLLPFYSPLHTCPGPFFTFLYVPSSIFVISFICPAPFFKISILPAFHVPWSITMKDPCFPFTHVPRCISVNIPFYYPPCAQMHFCEVSIFAVLYVYVPSSVLFN